MSLDACEPIMCSAFLIKMCLIDSMRINAERSSYLPFLRYTVLYLDVKYLFVFRAVNEGTILIDLYEVC